MNILEIKKKINVKEELLSLYEENNISVEETKDGYIIVDNMFLMYMFLKTKLKR